MSSGQTLAPPLPLLVVRDVDHWWLLVWGALGQLRQMGRNILVDMR